MTDAKHTPGPWMVAGVRGKVERQAVHNVFRYDAEKKKDDQIAVVWYDEKTGLGFADARLIAAAPSMFDALLSAEIAVAELCNGQDPANECWVTLATVRAAIAKAKGGAA